MDFCSRSSYTPGGTNPCLRRISSHRENGARGEGELGLGVPALFAPETRRSGRRGVLLRTVTCLGRGRKPNVDNDERHGFAPRKSAFIAGENCGERTLIIETLKKKKGLGWLGLVRAG